jgi:predicted acetyltransferase
VINKIVWEYLEPSGRTSLPRLYIHLIRVATAPQWQRHGAGTLLCNWGIDVAQKHKLQIGLLATPSGQALYSQLGWKELTRAVVQMPKEKEKESVSMMVMKWYPKEESIFAQALGGVYKFGEVLGRTLCSN